VAAPRNDAAYDSNFGNALLQHFPVNLNRKGFTAIQR
jgi:hypothetical protein